MCKKVRENTASTFGKDGLWVWCATFVLGDNDKYPLRQPLSEVVLKQFLKMHPRLWSHKQKVDERAKSGGECSDCGCGG